ncbi:MAG: hypothetical protein Q4E91_04865 [Lachnospiraceae bacterium]|nr:hypothetical protein [Lachnospiraceae bacterium]
MEKTDFVRAAYAANTIEADQMIDILRQNGIIARKQGGIKDIYMGGSVMGEEVMVPEGSLEQAVQVLSNFRPIQTTSPQRWKQENGEKKVSAKSAAAWIIGMAAVLILLMVLLAVISGMN